MVARLPVMDLRLPSWLLAIISLLLFLFLSSSEVPSSPVLNDVLVVLEYLIAIGLRSL